LKVVTAQEMREIDRKTIEGLGIAGHVLMERAGGAVAIKIRELFGKRKVIVLAGSGNNGGDGIVTARELYTLGWNVRVLLLAREERLSPDCAEQYAIARKIGVPVAFSEGVTATDLHSAIVVDALLGTGLHKDVEGSMADTIRFLNGFHSPVVSVDIPSGISSDTGHVMGTAVRADYTVTFGLPKRGHLLYPGAEYTGRLFIENIGFPASLLDSDDLRVELPERLFISSLVPERKRYSHKGSYGHVLIIAGSRGKTGAAFMAAQSCLRAGAGLVTMGVPESLLDVFQSRVTEEMTLPLPDRGDGNLSYRAAEVISGFLSERADVLCIGPGIGVSGETERLLEELVRHSKRPMVIDADGLNSIRDPSAMRDSKAPLILTPHPGEMARLLKGGTGQEVMKKVEGDRISVALDFSAGTGSCLVLKGVPTIIAGPEGRAFVNPTGNPGMATGGAGDVLTGMIASFLGQGLRPFHAAVLGVYMHGLAGDMAAGNKGEHSLIASDIIDALPDAFKELYSDTSRYRR
jgi:ADP-dependent NAD(P)H-hydrate dehydratase / NAD(P)H-hydrate epimerase